MKKKQVRLTESDLTQIVKESVNKILSEDESVEAKRKERFLFALRNALRVIHKEYRRMLLFVHREQGVKEIRMSLADAMNRMEDIISGIEGYENTFRYEA